MVTTTNTPSLRRALLGAQIAPLHSRRVRTTQPSSQPKHEGKLADLAQMVRKNFGE